MSRTTALALLASLGACGTAASRHSAPSPSGPTVITSEQIERSGANTAWDVLKRAAPMLTLRDDRRERRRGHRNETRGRIRASVAGRAANTTGEEPERLLPRLASIPSSRS